MSKLSIDIFEEFDKEKETSWAERSIVAWRMRQKKFTHKEIADKLGVDEAIIGNLVTSTTRAIEIYSLVRGTVLCDVMFGKDEE